jgi:hypothetical protein
MVTQGAGRVEPLRVGGLTDPDRVAPPRPFGALHGDVVDEAHHLIEVGRIPNGQCPLMHDQQHAPVGGETVESARGGPEPSAYLRVP